jgi:hypothetical protein
LTKTGTLSPKGRKWARRGVIAAAVVGLIALAYYLALPHVIEAYIRSQLAKVSASAGREITFESLELERLNKYTFRDLRVSDSGASSAQDFLRAARVTVTLDRTRLFAGQVVIRGVEVESPIVYLRDYPDGTSNYAELWRGLQEQLGLVEPEPRPDAGAGGEGTGRGDRGRTERLLAELMGGVLPTVRVLDAQLDVSGARGDNPPPGLRDVDIEVISAGVGLACDFSVTAEFEALGNELLARPFRRLELRGSVNPGDELAQVMLATGEPMELVQLPGLPELSVRVSEVGYEYPYTFRVRGLELVERRTREPVLRAPELVVSLQELTTEPERLYISLLEIDGLRLYLDMEAGGRTNLDRLLGLERGLLAQLGLPVGEDDEEPPREQPPATTTPEEPREPTAWERELRRRKWWEIAPQTTVLTDLQVELRYDHEDGRRALRLELPNLRAAKRLLNFQMDVSTEAIVSERGGGRLAVLGAEFVFYYMTDHWRLELNLEDLDAGRLVEVVPIPNPLEVLDGRFTGTLAVAENRPQRPLTVQADIALANLAFIAEGLDDARIDGVNASWGFSAEVDRQSNFDMSRGELVFNGVEAEVLLTLEQLDMSALLDYLLDFKDAERRARGADQPDPLPWTTARLRVEMPRQPVMDVLAAVPGALRARLAGAEMTGEVGWRLDATAQYSLNSRGRLVVEIPRPAVADVLDEGVMLVALPAEVDVRRLLEPQFEFMFSDGIGMTRVLSVGPANPRWVPLADVSPFMVTSILNTEDQGFFENQGFNWLQFRRVIADLLETRRFGRGASTITMQLVKNVFLSRERQLSRKLAEMFLTYWTNALVPKERILEVYLNVIEFGPGINGISEAAEHYFGQVPRDLTLAEATFLVSIVPNPRAYHFYYEQGEITDRWWRHMQRYIERLRARQQITESEYEAAIARRPDFYIPREGDPALRPVPTEPALPEDAILPFLLDFEATGGEFHGRMPDPTRRAWDDRP